MNNNHSIPKLTRREFVAAAGGASLTGLTGLHSLTMRRANTEPVFEKLELFAANSNGYASYRIPGLIVTRRGALLAYAEARRTGRGDWDAIDIVLKRSTDGGQTWTEQRKIAEIAGASRNPAAAREASRNQNGQAGLTYNNPVAIADRTGVAHFLFCLEYARCFYLRSTDDGATFSPPVEITSAFEQFRKEYDWKVIATGPTHGIQLRSGRLVAPVWLSTSTGKSAHHPSDNAVIYSDDHGKTWKAGGFVGHNSAELVDPSEAVLVELSDGRVMFNSRSESNAQRRAVSFSKNGATGWTKPVFHDQLVEPICAASMVRLSAPPQRSRLLFANPHNLTRADGDATPGKSRERKNLSVKLSYDEGATWPINKAIEPGSSGYSDLAVGADGTIYCLYESPRSGGNLSRNTTLMLARFNLEWLTEGKDSMTETKRKGKTR